jgi:hypothetical protein
MTVWYALVDDNENIFVVVLVFLAHVFWPWDTWGGINEKNSTSSIADFRRISQRQQQNTKHPKSRMQLGALMSEFLPRNGRGGLFSRRKHLE